MRKNSDANLLKRINHVKSINIAFAWKIIAKFASTQLDQSVVLLIVVDYGDGSDGSGSGGGNDVVVASFFVFYCLVR